MSIKELYAKSLIGQIVFTIYGYFGTVESFTVSKRGIIHYRIREFNGKVHVLCEDSII